MKKASSIPSWAHSVSVFASRHGADIGLMDKQKTGAAAELICVADLLLKGYEVFRSCTLTGSCDLVAIKEGWVYRVEVKTAAIHEYGTIGCPSFDSSKSDVVAVVVLDKGIILYRFADPTSQLGVFWEVNSRPLSVEKRP